ncbi:Site-specific recombinase XerD [Yoonia litorea]|uniref:Site-specific recombinase XerD n=2 Tax=Yoonia litorea TaxID=1123755 RepID=A0A1I6MG60_9RHOB|nr:Site-specific recombinase XerD [Yoonia litorea]
MPCGDVSYSKAVQMVVTWAEEHDELIASLRDPDKLQKAGVEASRQQTAKQMADPDPLFPAYYAMTEQREGEKQFYTRESLPRPWQAAAVLMQEAQRIYEGKPSLEAPIWRIKYRIEELERGDQITSKLSLPSLPGLKEYVARLDNKIVAAARIEVRDTVPMPLYAELYLDKLNEAHDLGFGVHAGIPTDPDEREEYDFIKRKLERRISELSPDPSTLTALLERYCDFNSIRLGPRSKYRRDLSRLIAITGDVPIGHVRVESLRELRDQLLGKIKPSSIQAVFTPIKGVFGFAFDEGIIEMNPMQGVKLPRDKRPIEERKWKPFDPIEFGRIMKAAEELWSSPVRGLSDARREAIHMVVRVLAFSGMRPVEVIRLGPDDVTDAWIRITGSKTESSTRVVPLHPEISDFPRWIASGGLTTFQSINTDQVGSVRHNFGRLLRDKMKDPITDPQKALYSLRSTFVNAMRRAGADIQVQRAILGHKEAGAIRHYDDGPEFEVKRKWVEATDPRR